MNKKKLFISIITVFAILVFSVTFFRTFYYMPSDEIPLSASALQSISEKNNISSSDLSSFPVKLKIPKINVDAKVIQVGVTKSGNMATPNNFTDVGWYKYGTIPGRTGSAVIAGHLDNGLSLAGVFFKLKDLSKGDDIYVTGLDGEELHFVVTNTEMFDFNASSGNVFTQSDGKFLKLITCSGAWVPRYKTHDKRLVVSAILVEK